MRIPLSKAARHASRTRDIASQIRDRKPDRPLSVRKKSVSHEVPKPHDSKYVDDKVDIGSLTEILDIDVEDLTCTAEAGVTFEALVAATLPCGLAPMVVPELRSITIGGAVSGCSLESMSFKYGGFHDTCLEYEVITATGEILQCTPENDHRLIFQMLHGAFGTLGILTKLKFKLVAAKPYVRTSYERFATLVAFKEAIARHFHARDVDFMDGIIHGPESFVLNLGHFVESAPYAHRYEWHAYYRTTAWRAEDYLATADYFFRYDHGVTNVSILRSGPFLRVAELLHRFIPAARPTVTVDLFIPFSRVDDYLSWHVRSLGFFPLWCVPYRRVRDYEWLSPDFFAGIDDELFLDLAIYGMKQPQGRNCYKEIEDELVRVNGMKTLISYNYYDEESFWRIFNRPNYLAVKQITDPENVFRDLYVKTCRAPLGLS